MTCSGEHALYSCLKNPYSDKSSLGARDNLAGRAGKAPGLASPADSMRAPSDGVTIGQHQVMTTANSCH
ncbi:hypothetical protein Y032_0774g2245 [Ancylostoma ceylanicum]|uniref:Uncharacterized protein n=1 Tax=Ancylostoma ceylanicum TaxID=53326 RepID=A0A016WDH6_9BILA|nr:hypothetical protein Y032_0774g2245 [Ancylostoma ceylanicum]